jgi:hypothetical protein
MCLVKGPYPARFTRLRNSAPDFQAARTRSFAQTLRITFGDAERHL